MKNIALDEALSQLSAPKRVPPKPAEKTAAQKQQTNTTSTTATTTTSNTSPNFSNRPPPLRPNKLNELTLPKDNLITDQRAMVTVHMLGARFMALCSRVLPFGNVGELELQVLALTSTGYAQNGGADLWLQKSRLAREFGRRWFQRLRQAHSELHRALHTFTKVALLLSYLDTFASPTLEETEAEGKKSPRTEARTAAEVIGSAHVSRKDALELAIWFQDSVCSPSEGDVVSKRESSSLFEKFARDGGLPNPDRCRISRTIRQTAIFSNNNSSSSSSSSSKNGSKFKASKKQQQQQQQQFSSLDIDTGMLRSFNRIFLFGALRSVHCERSHRLRLEYRHLPNAKWCKRRAGILREYLTLKRFLEPNGGSVWMPLGELRDQVEREIRRNVAFEMESLRRGELPGEEKIMKAAGGPILPLLTLPRYMDDGGSGQVYMTPLVDGREDGGSNDSVASSVSHCVLVPGGRTLRQSRSTPIVYYVLRGIGEVFRGGRADDLRTNDTIRIKANVPHHFINRHQEQELFMLVIGATSAIVLE
jgi:mannose-6-phosphate isomerase-like protein (cupin superfamily)/predicted metal-dependent HD superfamily phosphohydrolase